MNEGTENMLQLETMGLAGEAIHAISHEDLYIAREDLRNALRNVNELIEAGEYND